ncbi:hypothetical protein F2Q70_00037777 [Brassica cretica]|uniref:Uncharacterized protein n=1 Tax=Brassica cretica TaxID=69181 RepID=A0A8S9JN37_BRACR|nr:hypothetical protein F2Q70_00037777 [Brassica cretica]
MQTLCLSVSLSRRRNIKFQFFEFWECVSELSLCGSDSKLNSITSSSDSFARVACLLPPGTFDAEISPLLDQILTVAAVIIFLD